MRRLVTLALLFLPLGCVLPRVLGLPPEALRKEIPPSVRDTAVRVGAQAPDFSLPSMTGEVVRLSDLLKRKTVVLVFYRGQW